MISTNSLKNFVFVNGFLFLLGYYQYQFMVYAENTYHSHLFFKFLFTLFVFVTRNYMLLNFIDYGTKNKPNISIDYENIPKEEYKYEFHINVITTTTIETMTHLFIQNMFQYQSKNIDWITSSSNNIIYCDIFSFIPYSFIFEIAFDFFHYFAHRLLHHKYIYKYLHKKHHKFKHPISITTFYQDPVDLIITNSIPTILTLSVIPKISYLQFHFIVVYKNFIEISGHSGRISYPTCSFPQFVWLPKLLHIELYTHDHDLHHSRNNCNYSKRFSLWDKMFGTYKSSKM
jgi:sterol desaturase/sphingolipid hydroxylase (fatty acid hydroxylase superfamily)